MQVFHLFVERIILNTITITIRLLVGLQAQPCPSTGKVNNQWRAL